MRLSASAGSRLLLATLVTFAALTTLGHAQESDRPSCKCAKPPGGGVVCSPGNIAVCNPRSGSCDCNCEPTTPGGRRPQYVRQIVSVVYGIPSEKIVLESEPFRIAAQSLKRLRPNYFTLTARLQEKDVDVFVGVPSWLDTVLQTDGARAAR